MKMEYDQIVLIIFNNKGLSEHNFIISLKDLKESCSDFANLLEKHKKNQKFDTYHLTPNKTMSAKICRNMQEFNLFVSGDTMRFLKRISIGKMSFARMNSEDFCVKIPFKTRSIVTIYIN